MRQARQRCRSWAGARHYHLSRATPQEYRSSEVVGFIYSNVAPDWMPFYAAGAVRMFRSSVTMGPGILR